MIYGQRRTQIDGNTVDSLNFVGYHINCFFNYYVRKEKIHG
jgi:hypothetical protein